VLAERGRETIVLGQLFGDLLVARGLLLVAEHLKLFFGIWHDLQITETDPGRATTERLAPMCQRS
jgi:hypothetical protein